MFRLFFCCIPQKNTSVNFFSNTLSKKKFDAFYNWALENMIGNVIFCFAIYHFLKTSKNVTQKKLKVFQDVFLQEGVLAFNENKENNEKLIALIKGIDILLPNKEDKNKKELFIEELGGLCQGMLVEQFYNFQDIENNQQRSITERKNTRTLSSKVLEPLMEIKVLPYPNYQQKKNYFKR